ncbi:hypothetical protein I79_006220 [Cricetulus griseus]|uniref:Uncharacterized protein n=1 Tax=Cricetulus griseus TaxID=10029 RepID=G3H791_CRIGR|nr:hypothetical protein I79_006220 [Cricetulus griseus]
MPSIPQVIHSGSLIWQKVKWWQLSLCGLLPHKPPAYQLSEPPEGLEMLQSRHEGAVFQACMASGRQV